MHCLNTYSMDKEISDKIKELALRMSTADIEGGQTKTDALFNEINSRLTKDEKSEAGRILRQELAAIRAQKRAQRRAKRTDIDVKGSLGDTLNMVSLSYIAKNYFHKDSSWIYQRLNGTKVNGKEAAFTNEELKTLSDALKDISRRISDSSLLIHQSIN